MVRGKRSVIILAITAAVLALVAKHKHDEQLHHQLQYVFHPFQRSVLHVSVTGKDRGRCIQTAPCATLAYASTLTRPGDIVEMESGTYAPQTIKTQGTARRRITFRARGRVILTRPAPASAASQSVALLSIVNSNYVTVRGLTVIGMKARPDYIASARPFGGEVLITDHTGPVATTGQGVVVEGLRVTHANNTCIKIEDGQSYVTVRNNTLTDCGQSGNILDHGIYTSGPKTRIVGNRIRGVSGFGIHCWGDHVTDEFIQGNDVSGASYAGIIAQQSGAHILGNAVHNNGYGIVAGPDAIIANNVIAQNLTTRNSGQQGSGILLVHPGHDRITHNTFYQNGFAEVWVSTGPYSAPITFKNNIVDGSGSDDRLFNMPAPEPPPGSTIDFNVYHNVSKTFAWGRHSTWRDPHLHPTLS